MKTKSVIRVNRSTSDAGRSDDGPRPMRNTRPSKKIPNASDRFYTDHQAEYEARGKRSEDRIARVEQHNSRYPKLRDELDHRRSISKPTAFARPEVGRRPRTNTCSVCGGFERRRPQRRPKRKYQRTKSRITKRRPKPRKYRAKRPRNKAVTSYSKTQVFSMDTQTQARDAFEDPRAGTSARVEVAASEVGSKKSDIDSKNPDTHPSVSSYDSFWSLDHEPMD